MRWLIIGKFIDLTGKKFCRLFVIKRVENKKTKDVLWQCLCDCGREINVTSNSLKSGNTKSCGCLKIEMLKQHNSETKKKYNSYNLSGDYGIGYTTKGEEFYFDLEDYDLIKNYCWRIHNRGYVACSLVRHGETKIDLLFHRVVMKCDNGLFVDHIKGKLSRNDNRKANLRLCTHQENLRNYPIAKNNTSGITGVSFDKTHQLWVSYIHDKKSKIMLGTYINKRDAIIARLNAEQQFYGEFASQKHLYKQYGIEVKV